MTWTIYQVQSLYLTVNSSILPKSEASRSKGITELEGFTGKQVRKEKHERIEDLFKKFLHSRNEQLELQRKAISHLRRELDEKKTMIDNLLNIPELCFHSQ